MIASRATRLAAAAAAAAATKTPTRRAVSGLAVKPSWTCPQCLSKQLQRQHAQARQQQRRTFSTKKPSSSSSSEDKKKQKSEPPPDHRTLGHQQELFITSAYSPGSPIFLPSGTRIFNRLVDFLRRQYVRYGFEEVLTPTIYKKALWARSGHLQNYAEDMYTVTGQKHGAGEGCCAGGKGTEGQESKEGEEGKVDGDDDGEFGLKPMNCPGHCLIFASKLRSYRDLPIRYADFSPLHRNEISGALSGLTRVRRFHQDDGHIFCRPCQVEEEIARTLDFVRVVYDVLRLGVGYRLVLSTRPRDHYIGTPEEWARAEDGLRRALDASGMPWTVNDGDGAFYGPKIDIVLRDSEDKEHQTATVQLDFQLPKRFELEYQAPAPELEARGESTDDPELLARYGAVRPVMIHRAVLGSVERLMALLIENYAGKWPFWLNPKQAIILTVNTSDHVVRWAEDVRDVLVGNRKIGGDGGSGGGPLQRESLSGQTGLAVDVDLTARPLGSKIREAHTSGYGLVLVVGEKDVEKGMVSLGKEALTPAEMRDRMLGMVDRFE